MSGTIDALNACLAAAARYGTPALVEALGAIPKQYHASLKPMINRQHKATALEVDYSTKR